MKSHNHEGMKVSLDIHKLGALKIKWELQIINQPSVLDNQIYKRSVLKLKESCEKKLKNEKVFDINEIKIKIVRRKIKGI